MNEDITSKNVVSVHDVLRTEILVNQALIDILIAKQVITEEELVKSIQNIRREQEKLLNESSKLVSIKR